MITCLLKHLILPLLCDTACGWSRTPVLKVCPLWFPWHDNFLPTWWHFCPVCFVSFLFASLYCPLPNCKWSKNGLWSLHFPLLFSPHYLHVPFCFPTDLSMVPYPERIYQPLLGFLPSLSSLPCLFPGWFSYNTGLTSPLPCPEIVWPPTVTKIKYQYLT